MTGIRDMLIQVGEQTLVFKGNYQEWLEETLQKSIFRDKLYLKFTQYASYSRLWELSRIVDQVERFCKEQNLQARKCDILDLGCGPGNITIPLGHLGYNVTGVDIDANAIASIEKRKKDLDNVRFICSDALEYVRTYRGKPFHIVICTHMLEHLKTPEALCCAVHKIMYKKGIFILIIPNLLGLSELLFERPAMIKRVLSIKIIPGRDHVQSFTLKRLKLLFHNCGFQLKSISSIASVFSLPFLGQSRFALLELKLPLPQFMAQSWVITAQRNHQTC